MGRQVAPADVASWAIVPVSTPALADAPMYTITALEAAAAGDDAHDYSPSAPAPTAFESDAANSDSGSFEDEISPDEAAANYPSSTSAAVEAAAAFMDVAVALADSAPLLSTSRLASAMTSIASIELAWSPKATPAEQPVVTQAGKHGANYFSAALPPTAMIDRGGPTSYDNGRKATEYSLPEETNASVAAAAAAAAASAVHVTADDTSAFPNSSAGSTVEQEEGNGGDRGAYGTYPYPSTITSNIDSGANVTSFSPSSSPSTSSGTTTAGPTTSGNDGSNIASRGSGGTTASSGRRGESRGRRMSLSAEGDDPIPSSTSTTRSVDAVAAHNALVAVEEAATPPPVVAGVADGAVLATGVAPLASSSAIKPVAAPTTASCPGVPLVGGRAFASGGGDGDSLTAQTTVGLIATRTSEPAVTPESTNSPPNSNNNASFTHFQGVRASEQAGAKVAAHLATLPRLGGGSNPSDSHYHDGDFDGSDEEDVSGGDGDVVAPLVPVIIHGGAGSGMYYASDGAGSSSSATAGQQADDASASFVDGLLDFDDMY